MRFHLQVKTKPTALNGSTLKANTTGLELMLAYRLDAWRPYLNVSAQERELTFGNGVSTWNSGLPLYQARAGLEWQMLSNFDWDFYVRSRKIQAQRLQLQRRPCHAKPTPTPNLIWRLIISRLKI